MPSPHQHRLRPRAAALATLGLVAAFAAPVSSALGSATQAGPVLTVLGTSGDDLVEIDTLPNGDLIVNKAPGVVDGTVYAGVSELRIFTANSNDTVDLRIESPLAVLTDTATGADSVFAEILAGSSGTMAVSIDARTSTNADVVTVLAESLGANLDLSVAHDMSTNDDAVKVEVKGQGQAQWLRSRLVSNASSTGNDVGEMIITSDAHDVFVGMNTALSGGAKLVVDHQGAGTVAADLRMFGPTATVELKGQQSSKVVNGIIGGSGSLVLFTEGPSSGNVVLSGSRFGSCSTTVGTIVNCG